MADFTPFSYEHDNEYELNFGLQPLSIEGTARFILTLRGEEIKKCYPCIGFDHKAIEKLAEHTHYLKIPELLKCISPFNRLSFCYPYVLLMEKLLGLTPSLRTQSLRVIFAELERIRSHMRIISALAQDLGSDIPKIYEIKQSAIIEHFLKNKEDLFQIGGIKYNITDEEIEDIYNWSSKKNNPFLEKISYSLSNNRIFKQRTIGIGIISAEDAVSWGLSGPSLRASGVSWDLRQSSPYDAYSSLSFTPTIENSGDVYSRYLVRAEEIKASLSLISQIIENIPPEENSTIDLSEEDFPSPPAKELYLATESPAGELGISIISDGSSCPYRFHIRTPSFPHLQALNYLGKDTNFGNLVPIIASFDLNMGEVDR